MRLTNKVAIVTGGGAGIGEAIANRYAQEGSRVVVADLSRSHGESTVDTIRKLGGEAIFAETDVASESQVQAMVQGYKMPRRPSIASTSSLTMPPSSCPMARFELMRCQMTSGIARSMSTSKVIACVRSM